MKKISTLFLTIFLIHSHIPTSFAKMKDVFFKGDKIHFIKTDKLKNSIKFSGCQLVDADKGTAKCEAIAKVNQDEFFNMQACILYSDEATVGLTFAAVAFGTGGTGLIVIAAGGTGVLLTESVEMSLDASLLYPEKRAIFDSKVENDTDHVSKISYQEFVDHLRDSMESSFFKCDVSGESELIKEKPQEIKLTSEQLNALNSNIK